MLDIILIYPSQLFEFNKYYKKLIGSKTKIFLLQHNYFFERFQFHKLKLAFHIATMKNYCNENKEIMYIEKVNLNELIKKYKPQVIKLYNPIEKELIKEIQELNQEFIFYDSPYFLNTHNENLSLKQEMNSVRHDNFYKKQRIKYNLLVDSENKPLYNKWSFDVENRNKFPNDLTNEPVNYKITKNKFTSFACKYVEKNYKNNYGLLENFIYPISRKTCLLWLKNFIKYKIANFGIYEDAMSDKIKFGFHSLLSPLLNVGLLIPLDIIKIIKKIKITEKNIPSIEGFIRQIIGWREYNYFIYDFYGEFLENNFFYKNHKNKISKNIWNCDTNIKYIDDILNKVNSYAYSHHIERLMGIGNYFNLLNIHPKEIYKWFSTMYIDAYDVFMIPNVYGMLLYGFIEKNKHMMTKPYICSSNYILKMSNYKKGDWCETINDLYYKLLKNNKEKFKKIYSLAMLVKKL